MNKGYPKEYTCIGHYLKKARLDKGMTQRKVATWVACTPEAVSYWEKGTEPQIRFIPQIVEFIGFDPFLKNGNSLADKVWNYQRKYGVTLSYISEQIGIDSGYFSQLIRGKYNGSKMMISKTIRFLKE